MIDFVKLNFSQIASQILKSSSGKTKTVERTDEYFKNASRVWRRIGLPFGSIWPGYPTKEDFFFNENEY